MCVPSSVGPLHLSWLTTADAESGIGGFRLGSRRVYANGTAVTEWASVGEVRSIDATLPSDGSTMEYAIEACNRVLLCNASAWSRRVLRVDTAPTGGTVHALSSPAGASPGFLRMSEYASLSGSWEAFDAGSGASAVELCGPLGPELATLSSLWLLPPKSTQAPDMLWHVALRGRGRCRKHRI